MPPGRLVSDQLSAGGRSSAQAGVSPAMAQPLPGAATAESAGNRLNVHVATLTPGRLAVYRPCRTQGPARGWRPGLDKQRAGPPDGFTRGGDRVGPRAGSDLGSDHETPGACCGRWISWRASRLHRGPSGRCAHRARRRITVHRSGCGTVPQRGERSGRTVRLHLVSARSAGPLTPIKAVLSGVSL